MELACSFPGARDPFPHCKKIAMKHFDFQKGEKVSETQLEYCSCIEYVVFDSSEELLSLRLIGTSPV